MRLLEIIGNIFRMLFMMIYTPLYVVIYNLIKFLTNERGYEGIITLRKAKRIRFFLKLKLFLYKKVPWFINFINKEEEYKGIYKQMDWYGV